MTAVLFVTQEPAQDQASHPVLARSRSRPAASINSAPVRFAVTRSNVPGDAVERRSAVRQAHVRAPVERQVLFGRLQRVRVVIDPDDGRGAEPAGGDRQDARAGADVDRRLALQSSRCSAARHSRVVA